MTNLLMIDLMGTTLLDIEKTMLSHSQVGAVLLFARNFTSTDQLKSLIADIRTLRPDIFIAIDHEGGVVQRLQRHGFSALPAAKTYGVTYDFNKQVGLDLAKHYGEVMARELLNQGIDLSLAPVVDLDGPSQVIGRLDRAFHANPQAVSELASAFIDGMNKAGMPAVLKHFPGHGSCTADSHISQPVHSASWETIKATDLVPFQALSTKAAGVMPAHVIYSAVDAENPAGFSARWLTTILRQELAFNGLVISDCLGMKGADVGNLMTRALNALNAGCDMLIVANQPREVVLELLNTLSFEPSVATRERFATFKQRMVRFAADEVRSLNQLSQYNHLTLVNNLSLQETVSKETAPQETTDYEHLNNTLSI